MKVTSETLPERQVKLQIEVESDQHTNAIEEAYKRLAPRVQIPGFRSGKAPRTLIEKQLGRQRLLDEAMEIIIPKAYYDAIEEQQLSPVAQPDVELVSREPLVFAATVSLHPLVELGDYQSLRVARETVPVTDEQVEEGIRDLRKRYGTVEPVDRPVQENDVIRTLLVAAMGNSVLYNEEDIEFRVATEPLSTLPGLYDLLIEMKKGDEADTETKVPDDFYDQRVAGQTIKYHVKIHEVKEEKLAEEDDAFAKQVGEGFDSVRALHERVREDLQKAQDDQKLQAYEASVIDALLPLAKLEYPQVMLEHEIEHLMEDQTKLNAQDPRAQELYLQRLGKSEEEIKETVRPEAEQRLSRSLVLSQFAEAENITVSDEELQEEVQRMTLAAGEQALALLRVLDTEDGRATLRRSQLTRKTLNRLVELASQDAAPADATPVEEKKPAKARRAAPRRAAE